VPGSTSTEQELAKAYEPLEVERRWYPVWMERGYFTAQASSPRPPFSIVLPPPNVTGSLHLGHALTATIQDVLVRWKRMSGYNCLWLPGTDHAGIATQMVVEKELKRTEKKSRHDLGREEFLRRVWQWKEKYGARIGQQHHSLGASLDWTRERFTMDAGLSAAVREVFVRLHEQGLLYRAQKLINWCPSCRTALSDLEVEHEEKKGSLWHIRYPVKGEDRFLTVATTRPETMLGDTAVAIHPEDPRYRGLAGKTAVLPLVDREIPIIADAELVSMEFGTGAVKVTPGHDFNDYQTGLRHRLPMISIFDDAAKVNREGGPYAGLDRFEARKKVLDDLAGRGLLEKEEPHQLSLGGCQRCATPVEPRLSWQWFVKVEPLAKKAIAAVEEGRVRFVPESWTSTFFAWMRNIHDWCVSRQLWWGHQIPAWYCQACDAEAGQRGEQPPPLVAREAPTACAIHGAGATLVQDPDVLDTWFSSGLWPFSTLGWPEQTPELKTFYPTSVMETGHDIIFFWVARMMMMGLHFMGEVPFRVVYLHAMVRDEKGEKMSKTKGNVIDPLDVIEGAPADKLSPTLRNKFPQGMPAFGADALRFTLASLTQQGRDIKLSLDRVAGYKAFTNKLWNAARFALMNMGDYRLREGEPRSLPLTLADRWILARLNRATRETRAALEAFEFSTAASTLYQFLWRELCDWYIELSKPALYGDDERQKRATRAVLVYSLDRVLRLLHPFTPFITEEIWQKLPMDRPAESIMIAPYPEPDPALDDAAAEAEMQPVVAAIEGIRTIRGEADLPPQAKIEAHVQVADGRLRVVLDRWKGYVVPLAGLSELRVGEPGPKPPQSAAHVTEGMEIYVPLAGVIDLEAERARLQKEIARADADLASLERKLANPSFVERAPAEVVQKDRDRVEELRARKAKLSDHLKRIAPEERMPDQNDPPDGKPGAAAPPVSSMVTNPETGKVKIGEEAAGRGGEDTGPVVDLGAELGPELEKVKLPDSVDPQVKAALDKLREGTKEGLSPKDHYDLGVAYMGMGLVDDAVREFNVAASAKAPAKKGVKKKAASKSKPKKVARKVVKKAPKKPAKNAKKSKPKRR
jgi:valyl-tRNA synthetase